MTVADARAPVHADPRLRRLAADGQARQESRGRRRNSTRRPKLFQQGKLEEAETAFTKIAKNRKGTPWGENGPVLPGRDPVSAEASTSTPTTATRSSSPTIPRPSYLDKLVSREYALAQHLARPVRPQGQGRRKLPWTAHFDGRAAHHRHPGHGPQGPRARASSRPDGPARRRRRPPDRRLPHEASATTSPPRSITISSSPITTRAPSCRRPSSPRSMPG